MCKYADDTYVIVPANNVDTRSSEVNNVEAWAEANKQTLNRNKSVEIVFTKAQTTVHTSTTTLRHYVRNDNENARSDHIR